MEESFVIGDVVFLKSGGPRMTVTGIKRQNEIGTSVTVILECAMHVDHRGFKHISLPQAALTKVKPIEL